MLDSRHIERVIQQTADGSHTLFVPSLGEHYHSVNGAVQEGMHVFIEAGLAHCIKDRIAIFEVGFGTGLNALLTAKYIKQYKETINPTINYVSMEAYPLSSTITQELNYASEEDSDLYNKLHAVKWESEQKINNQFYLTKIEADFTQFDFSSFNTSFDLIYFDAFAPDIQPQMWSQEIFNAMYQIAKEGAILTTYCAKGEVRRRMQSAGFTVERIPGPIGKREMLRARK